MLTLSEENNFPSSADLSDNTVRNILQICALWQAYETKDFVFHIAQLQLVNRFHKKKLFWQFIVHQFIIELPQSNGKHIRNFQDPKLLTYGLCMRQVIAIGNYS